MAKREPARMVSEWDVPDETRVGIVGNPNVGKSVIFGLLTGRYTTVSNYPGTTVEISRGRLSPPQRSAAGRETPRDGSVTDTPGTNSLIPQSEDERVTRDFLLEGPCTVLQVGDAKNLTRTLALTLEIAEAGLPFVLCLNMADEAGGRGIAVDSGGLARRLGVAVAMTVATRREGTSRLPGLLASARRSEYRIDYPRPIEAALEKIEPLMPDASLSSRTLALAVLSGDATLAPWLTERMTPAALAILEGTRRSLAQELGAEPGVPIQRRRLRVAAALAASVSGKGGAVPEGPAGVLGRLSMHPVWGVPIVGLVLAGVWLIVGRFGAQTAVGWLERGLFDRIVNPWVSGLFEAWSPSPFLTDLFVGPYGVVTMGLTYAIGIVLPIVATFFLVFSVLEDTGYLPRLAIMMNRPFRLMGLNGRAVLPMILGLGCDTMATLTARILSSRKERLIVTLLLALGIPCSAQLGVILGMLAALSWKAAALWGGVLAGVIVLTGFLASRVIPGRRSEFILEIPPLRMPSVPNLLRKTLARMEWYLREAVPLFVLGTLVLFLMDRTGLLRLTQRGMEPIVTGWLGLPAAASDAFIIGFLRRDFGAAGLFRLASEGRLDPVQTVVSLVTITLFIPCIANLFMIVKEQGARIAANVALFVFPFALLTGGVLNLVLRSLGADLR